MFKRLPLDCLRHLTEFLGPLDWSQLLVVSKTASTVAKLTSTQIYLQLLRRYPHLSESIKQLGALSIDNPVHLVFELTKERVFLCGGGSSEAGMSSYRQVDEMVILKSNQVSWVMRSSMPCHRGTFKTEACSWMGQLVLVSGDGVGITGTLASYCPLNDTWNSLPNLPLAVSYAASAAFGSSLFVSGGMDKSSGSSVSSIYRLAWANSSLGSNSKDAWESLRPMPAARFGHAMAVLNGYLWVVGGQVVGSNETEGSCSTARLCLATMKWSEGPKMSGARMWPRLMTVEGRMIVCGGDVDALGNSTKFPTVQSLHMENGLFSWTAPTPFSSQRRMFASTAVGGKVLIFGGCDQQYNCLNDWQTLVANGQNPSECLSVNEDMQLDQEDKLKPAGVLPRISFLGGGAVSVAQCPMAW